MPEERKGRHGGAVVSDGGVWEGTFPASVTDETDEGEPQLWCPVGGGGGWLPAI